MSDQWYLQRAKHPQSGNVREIQLKDGTRIILWTHNGGAQANARVLEITVVGEAFNVFKMFHTPKKETTK